MAFVAGKGSVVSLDANDLSAYSTQVEYELKADALDVTAFGNDYKIFQGGLIESSIKIEGTYDNTASTGPREVIEALVGQVAEMIWQPEGSGTGTPVRTWDVLIVTYTETSAVGEMIKFKSTMQGAAAVVTTTTP